MRVIRSSPLVWAGVLIVSVLSVASGAAQGAPTPDQMVATLKQNLAESQKRLRQYEWIETTVISLKGEEKARKQQRAYYGADGKLTRVPIGEPKPPAAPPAGRGRRGAKLKEEIIENKKDEMQDYMERAVNLIHQYVPPNPAQIQKAKDAGTMRLGPPQQGKMRVSLRTSFSRPICSRSTWTQRPRAWRTISVATYLDKREDAVTLDVQFSALTDGTSYSDHAGRQGQEHRVVVTNSGHRPLAR